MITLRNMDEEHYRSFLDYFIPDYAIEIMENYGKSKEEALLIASKEIENDLPEGIHTADNTLLCIHADEEPRQAGIGYLWYKENPIESSAFIYEFYIRPEYRSKGYGRRSMIALEEGLGRANIRQIKLRVAFGNERALALYKELGFAITGVNMAKNIG